MSYNRSRYIAPPLIMLDAESSVRCSMLRSCIMALLADKFIITLAMPTGPYGNANGRGSASVSTPDVESIATIRLITAALYPSNTAPPARYTQSPTLKAEASVGFVSVITLDDAAALLKGYVVNLKVLSALCGCERGGNPGGMAVKTPPVPLPWCR